MPADRFISREELLGGLGMPARQASVLLFNIESRTAKTVDGASAFAYPIVFLPFISSAFVPTESMPGPIRALPNINP